MLSRENSLLLTEHGNHCILILPGMLVDEVSMIVDEGDFHKALSELVPSLSAEELHRYANIQRQFVETRVNADGVHE